MNEVQLMIFTNVVTALAVITAILISGAIIAQIVYFTHWVIGSPSLSRFEDVAEYKKGAIFSAYGKWVTKNYNLFEVKRRQRLFAQALKMHQNDDVKALEELPKLLEEDNTPNPYKALGVCILCFSFWLSNALCTLGLVVTHKTLIPLHWGVCIVFYVSIWAVVLHFLEEKTL